MDNEDGSVSMIFWVPATLGLGLFLIIALGKVVDLLTQFQAHFALSNPSLPVSADRITYTGYMITGFWAIIIVGLLIPVLYYAILVAKRRTQSNI